MNDLEVAFDDDFFYDAMGLDCIVNGVVVRVLWQGESIDPSQSAFDYGMTGTALKMEVRDEDRHHFTKGVEVSVKGMTFHVFRSAIKNMSGFHWEVELEP